MCANRNKKSLAVNIHAQRGVEIVTKLVQEADVFIENFPPGWLSYPFRACTVCKQHDDALLCSGKLAKLGLDYDTLSRVNPKLVYASITGFGPDGPYAHRLGYDLIGAAVGGRLRQS